MNAGNVVHCTENDVSSSFSKIHIFLDFKVVNLNKHIAYLFALSHLWNKKITQIGYFSGALLEF